MKPIALGVDIGGTNTAYGLISQDGQMLHEGNVPTTEHDTPTSLVETIYGHVSAHLASDMDHQLVGIGVGAPNGNYYNGTIEYAPNLQWQGVINLIKIFGQFFNVPTYVTNDANAATLGEMHFGAARKMQDFVMITLGTGVGSGFVANGQLIYGKHGFGGEVGHQIISPDGRDCACGRAGCLETYASATGVVRTAHILLAKSGKESALRSIPAKDLTGRSITAAAREGDELALEIFEYTASRLGFSLANVVAITDPEAIILFGGLANAGDLLLRPTRKYLEEHLLSIFKGKVKVLISDLQTKNAAVLGAGALVWDELKSERFDEVKIRN